ncbi:hypothetical protein FHU36_006406 [Nonomuraea muscovyensis]|uniref:Uncharacterized protein n=1 Tax=Nonomuraea muscovyensis TaxID=1124761 RepID=A0A7X0C936_9ACTN|nr:hypothetical protein [Nonomuraea muscovyensis]
MSQLLSHVCGDLVCSAAHRHQVYSGDLLQ